MQNAIKDAITALSQGKMIVVADDVNRENEGDIVVAAEKVTKEHITFMAKEASGLICVPLSQEWARSLGLNMMTSNNEEAMGTAFTVSVDARYGISTGISASDRVRTIEAIVQRRDKYDLVKPGHIFPLLARPGGVLERQGHTEASVDLVMLAGLKPVSVVCEIMDSDGEMVRGKALKDFASKHALPFVSIAQLVTYLKEQKQERENDCAGSIVFSSHVNIPVDLSAANKQAYFQTKGPVDAASKVKMLKGFVAQNKVTGKEHFVVYNNEGKHDGSLLVRMHSECLTGDVFHSLRCECYNQLQYALGCVAASNYGAIIYLRQEGRGIGLFNKIEAYKLQERGLDTVEANLELGLGADERGYAEAANILKTFNPQEIYLMTNNTLKVKELQELMDIKVTPVEMPRFENPHNAKYLKTKQEKMHHRNMT